MTIEQILKLIDAGYNKTEIEAMSSHTSQTDPAPDTTTPAQAEQVTAPAPAEPTTQEVDTHVDPMDSAAPVTPAPAPDDSARWTALLAEIADMKKTLHAQNIRRGVDTPAPKPIDEELAEQWIANGESKK
jgi:hypothetical protein